MKKAILVLLAMAILLLGTTAYAATAMTEVIGEKNLRVTPPEYLYVYSGATVAADTTARFTVPLKYSNGYISFCRVTTGSSTSADIWLSGQDSYGVDGPYTYLHGTTIAGSFTFPIEKSKPYLNTESTVEEQLTLTFQNNDLANETLTWYLMLVLEGK